MENTGVMTHAQNAWRVLRYVLTLIRENRVTFSLKNYIPWRQSQTPPPPQPEAGLV
jgi:hypothetical protein